MEKIFGTQNLKNVVLNTWGADVCAQACERGECACRREKIFFIVDFYCRAFALLI